MPTIGETFTSHWDQLEAACLDHGLRFKDLDESGGLAIEDYEDLMVRLGGADWHLQRMRDLCPQAPDLVMAKLTISKQLESLTIAAQVNDWAMPDWVDDYVSPTDETFAVGYVTQARYKLIERMGDRDLINEARRSSSVARVFRHRLAAIEAK